MSSELRDTISAVVNKKDHKRKGVPPEKVRPASDDVDDVMGSNFNHAKNVGEKQLRMDDVRGGVRLSDPKEAKRVNNLADRISSDDGYFARPIVDEDHNILEGQHRVEAARKLGWDEIPVHVIKNLAKGFDEQKIKSAAQTAQKLHPDHAHQIVRHVLEAIDEAGSVKAARDSYDAPPGYERSWRAALHAAENLEK